MADPVEKNSHHTTQTSDYSSFDFGLGGIKMEDFVNKKYFSNQVKPILSPRKHFYKPFDKQYMNDFQNWLYSNPFEEE